MNAKFYTYETLNGDEKTKCFALEIRNHRIILSNPRMQVFDSSKEYTGLNDILYFYHSFIIEENKNYLEDDDGSIPEPDWQRHSSTHISEDSMTRRLSGFIDEVLSFDSKVKSRRRYFTGLGGVKSKTDYECCDIFELSGICEEDNFAITKHFRHFDYSADTNGPKECEFYNMFFGCGQTELDYNISGINTYLQREDLLIVKKWANEFMSYVDDLMKGSQ